MAPGTGHYEVDGYQPLLYYSDSHEERRLIVCDVHDPKSVMWLDGTAYTRQR